MKVFERFLFAISLLYTFTFTYAYDERPDGFDIEDRQIIRDLNRFNYGGQEYGLNEFRGIMRRASDKKCVECKAKVTKEDSILCKVCKENCALCLLGREVTSPNEQYCDICLGFLRNTEETQNHSNAGNSHAKSNSMDSSSGSAEAIHTENNNDNNQASALPSTRTYPCPLCATRFGTIEDIKGHLHKNEDKKFLCAGRETTGQSELLCHEHKSPMGFDEIWKFTQHMRRQHAERSFICGVDGEHRYTTEAQLRHHERTIHSIPNIPCWFEDCQEVFLTRKAAVKHKSGHVPRCWTCKRNLGSIRRLEKHRLHYKHTSCQPLGSPNREA